MSHCAVRKPSVTPSGKIMKVQASKLNVSDLEENSFKKCYTINALNVQRKILYGGKIHNAIYVWL